MGHQPSGQRRRLAFGGATLAVAAAALVASVPAPAQVGSGFFLIQERCQGCHTLERIDPQESPRPRGDWERILRQMVDEQGAVLNPREFTLVLEYLDSFNNLPAAVEWVRTPASSHQLRLAATDVGKAAPAPLVAQTTGAPRAIPWAIAEDTATKALFLSPVQPAPAGQFPLLIDNSGVVSDGAITVRVLVGAGDANAGAGVVFGYADPASYFGARISAATNDVVLYRVTPEARALLARARTRIEPDTWHTLAVTLRGGQASVSLNGKPLPQLTRAVAGYRPGPVGFGAQGASVARFDGWSVSVAP